MKLQWVRLQLRFEAPKDVKLETVSRRAAFKWQCIVIIVTFLVWFYLAWWFYASNNADEDDDPGEKKTNNEIPLDDVRVHVDARRHAQYFVSTSGRHCFSMRKFPINKSICTIATKRHHSTVTLRQHNSKIMSYSYHKLRCVDWPELSRDMWQFTDWSWSSWW